MMRRQLVLASLCLLVAHAVAAEAPADAQIRATFEQYRQALLEGDGAKAATAVSARTIAYYDEILIHTLTTPRAKLAGLDFISKFMVLRLRHEFTKAEIEAMNGRELFITAVRNGWISKASVTKMDRLVNIDAGAREATASVPAAPEIPLFEFVKESGAWKLNLFAFLSLGNEAMQYAVTKSGLTEEEFLVRMLGAVSKKKVEERIFSPLE